MKNRKKKKRKSFENLKNEYTEVDGNKMMEVKQNLKKFTQK